MHGFDVLAPQPCQDLFVALARPLILMSHLGDVDLVAEMVFLVDQISSAPPLAGS
jgi:hypothetical protein